MGHPGGVQLESRQAMWLSFLVLFIFSAKAGGYVLLYFISLCIGLAFVFIGAFLNISRLMKVSQTIWSCWKYHVLTVSLFLFALQKHNFPINYTIRVHSYEVFKLSNISTMVRIMRAGWWWWYFDDVCGFISKFNHQNNLHNRSLTYYYSSLSYGYEL